VCVALGNTADASALPALENASHDPELLIAEHARWAIEQVISRANNPLESNQLKD
jgi:epoxyqueuosine reductase